MWLICIACLSAYLCRHQAFVKWHYVVRTNFVSDTIDTSVVGLHSMCVYLSLALFFKTIWAASLLTAPFLPQLRHRGPLAAAKYAQRFSGILLVNSNIRGLQPWKCVVWQWSCIVCTSTDLVLQYRDLSTQTFRYISVWKTHFHFNNIQRNLKI